MRTSTYILAALAVAGSATAGPHHASSTASIAASNPASSTAGITAGNPARTPGVQTPVNQPSISPPEATPMPPPGVTPTQPPGVTPMQPMRNNPTGPIANNPAVNQQRIAPASRGVGTPGKPDCSRFRGVDKSECERRDTVRDDLPAGVTTTQPKR